MSSEDEGLLDESQAYQDLRQQPEEIQLVTLQLAEARRPVEIQLVNLRLAETRRLQRRFDLRRERRARRELTYRMKNWLSNFSTCYFICLGRFIFYFAVILWQVEVVR